MMNEDDRDIRKLLKRLERDAILISKRTPTDVELADTVGTTRRVEVLLSETRRRWERLVSEMETMTQAELEDAPVRVNPSERAGPPVAVGKRYELVPQYKTNRSFNTPAILVSIAEETGASPMDALQDALGADAVRLTWRWTQLKKFLRDRQVPLRIGYQEVTDHDGTDTPMVGEVRVQAGVKRVALKEGT